MSTRWLVVQYHFNMQILCLGFLSNSMIWSPFNPQHRMVFNLTVWYVWQTTCRPSIVMFINTCSARLTCSYIKTTINTSSYLKVFHILLQTCNMYVCCSIAIHTELSASMCSPLVVNCSLAAYVTLLDSLSAWHYLPVTTPTPTCNHMALN